MGGAAFPIPCRARAGEPGYIDDPDFRSLRQAGRADVNHVERFYFTRELGGTRWERWENRNGTPDFSRERVAELSAQIASSGRCSPAEVPPGGAPLVMTDCREWTRIVPPSDPRGDPPGFLLEALRARGEALDLFGPPPPGSGKPAGNHQLRPRLPHILYIVLRKRLTNSRGDGGWMRTGAGPSRSRRGLCWSRGRRYHNSRCCWGLRWSWR
jgi:hypothetical protein